jgi:DNA-binding transcriptional regulator YdaS (Cro superfamily)
MSRALVIAAALAALAALAGACRDPQLSELQKIRDEVCACKTPACAKAALERVLASDVRSDHVTQKVARSMMDCFAKVQESDRPSTDLDAEAPAESAGSGSDAAAGSGASAGSAVSRPAGSASRPPAPP